MRKYIFNPINDKTPNGAVVKGTTVTYRLQVSKFEKPTNAFFVAISLSFFANAFRVSVSNS